MHKVVPLARQVGKSSEAHGEFVSEHPGYCGAQDTFYVGNLRGSAGSISRLSLTPIPRSLARFLGRRPVEVGFGRLACTRGTWVAGSYQIRTFFLSFAAVGWSN